MKKCASCTKDLPEAALHCVFCGAKQPPAPAVQPGLAKTAFGYSNEMMEQLKKQAPPSSGPGPYVPPAPQPAYQPAQQPAQPRHPPSQPPYGGGLAPSSAANAATMFVQGGPPGASPQPPQQQPQAAFMPTAVSPPPPQQYPQPPYQPQYPQPVPQPMAPPMSGMGVQGPQNAYAPQPIAPVPYRGGAQMHDANAPIEPWKDALPLVMIVWGIATLVAFVVPLSIHPLVFNWDTIIHGEGTQKLPMLVIAALGLLGVVIGAIPMAVMPRGILAALLGISAVLVPLLVAGSVPPWQILVPLVGLALLIPGQLIRNEYVESTLSRVLVTLGVIGVLLPLVVPEHGQIPLVALLKAVLNGHIDSGTISALATIVFVVVNLLAWLPGPATGGGKVFAWIWILAPFIITAITVGSNASHLPDMIKESPAMLVAWIPMTAAAAFVGYGLATVFGKQLE
ncbi:MAG: hypothetical protein ABI467_32560 [Kofleriaceae bacterium]